MLKIIKNPEFTTAVKVQIPTSGGHTEASFNARFKVLTVSETEAFNMLSTEGTSDYLRTILIGWDGVIGDEGEPISFSDEARDQLIDIPYVRVAILSSYNSAMLGAKRGN